MKQTNCFRCGGAVSRNQGYGIAKGEFLSIPEDAPPPPLFCNGCYEALIRAPEPK